jgi:hypothetical protein
MSDDAIDSLCAAFDLGRRRAVSAHQGRSDDGADGKGQGQDEIAATLPSPELVDVKDRSECVWAGV